MRNWIGLSVLCLVWGGAIGCQAPEDDEATADAELATGSINVTLAKVGIVPNKPSAATQNTIAFRKLVSPVEYGGGTVAGFTGQLYFPKGDYYFNDTIPMRDNVHIDLRGSTLHYTRTAVATDIGAAFLMVLRDFSITNGKIISSYDNTALNVIHAGHVFHLGTRGSITGTKYFPNFYDEEQPQLGNITLSNIEITATNRGSTPRAILMLGGLENVVFNGVKINGTGTIKQGIAYEFGTGSRKDAAGWWRSSHAHNIRFTNIVVTNLEPTPSTQTQAVRFGGAYDVVVDGLTVDGASVGFAGDAGEAAYYRPHKPIVGTPTITLKHLTMSNISMQALNLSGAGSWTGGYLGKLVPNPLPADETDHINYVVDGFRLCRGSLAACIPDNRVKSTTGSGIISSAGRLDIKNGTIVGFYSDVVVTDDCTEMYFDNIEVYNSSIMAMRLNFGSGIWPVARPKKGYIKNSLIAGSGSSTIAYQAIALANTSQFLIDGNVFGFDNELTQGSAVLLSSTKANNVTVSNNLVSGIVASQSAYMNQNTTAALGDTLQTNTGVTTSRGAWILKP